MTKFSISLQNHFMFSRELALKLISSLTKYESSIMIRDKNRTVNARSLLGIVSLGIISSDNIEFIIDGPDEENIKETIQSFFEKI